MGATLDRTELADRLDLIAAASEFLVATEARRVAERRLLRLARRIVEDATLTDAEIVPAAYRVARAAHAELAGASTPDNEPGPRGPWLPTQMPASGAASSQASSPPGGDSPGGAP